MNFLFTLAQYVGICALLWVVYLMLPKSSIPKHIKGYVRYGLYVTSLFILIFGVWQASTTYGYKHGLDATYYQQYVPENMEVPHSNETLVEKVDRFGTFDKKLEDNL